MATAAILEGTFADNRANIIKTYIREGLPIYLIREPKNKHDQNAIAAYLGVPTLWGLLGHRKFKIGYIAKARAAGLAKKMDAGFKPAAIVKSFHFWDGCHTPRVSISFS